MGLWTLALYGVGDMLGAGIYGLVGRAAGQLGNAVWLAFIASMVAAVSAGLSYAEIGSRYPRAAGSAYLVNRAFGKPFLSYLVGLMTMASGMVSMAAGSRVIAGYLQGLLGTALPVEFFVVAFLGLLTIITLWGMRESIYANVVCTVVEVIGLLIVLAVGIKYWGSVDYLQVPPHPETGEPGTLGLALMLQGAVLTFYSFIGFEDMLNVTEEVKDPSRTFPRAMILALSMATVLYIGIAITAVSVVPYAELAASKEPLVEVVRRAAPWFPSAAFSIIAVFAVSNTVLLNYLMGSRLLYGMAKHELLPAPLAKVHHKRRTPHVAILTLVAIVLVLALSGDISVLAKATSVLLMSVFIFVNASLLVIKRRPNEPQGHFRVPSFVPVVGIVVCAAMLSYAAAPELKVAGILVAIIIGLFFVIRPKRFTDEDLSVMD
jgi:APA family basic amino acid/polyamine antiporter